MPGRDDFRHSAILNQLAHYMYLAIEISSLEVVNPTIKEVVCYSTKFDIICRFNGILTAKNSHWIDMPWLKVLVKKHQS